MKLTRQSILAVSSLLVGGLLGASALVAAAGTWTQAPSNPPDNNAEAPVNVSDQVQTKTGLLGLANFQFLPSSLITTVNGVATGNVVAGSVLTAKDNNGTVGWTELSGFTPGDNCSLIATASSGTGDHIVNVPTSCINSMCSLVLAATNPSNDIVSDLRVTVLTQFQKTAKVRFNADNSNVYWWAKYGGSADGTSCGTTDCSSARNGYNDAIGQVILKVNDYLHLDDDKNSVEVAPNQWTLVNNQPKAAAKDLELYVCK